MYDTNVGDIAPLSTYFNPRKWTVRDLNTKFGQRADGFPDHRNFSPFPSQAYLRTIESIGTSTFPFLGRPTQKVYHCNRNYYFTQKS